jgi:ferric-dicitrate binding protein FerR (iron transport regulator)
LLHAGQLGRLVAGKVMTSTDTDVAMAWTRGALAFDNQPLAEVLPAIGRRFDIVLQADPALATRRLTARFTTQSLDEVLRTLTLALDVNVVTKGRLITLAPVSR